MNTIYLVEFTTMDIIVAIAYGLLSLIIGLAIGYSMNSKYKKQVVDFEQDNVKLKSSVNSLEAQLEETKKARTNADDEIVLLRNRLRDRDVRIRETEGKMALISKKLEESQAAVAAKSDVKEIQLPSAKKEKVLETVGLQTEAKVEKLELKASTPEVKAPSVKSVETITSSVTPTLPKVKKDKKKSSSSSSKSKKAAKASSDEGKKRGRPAGSKNKKSEGSSATLDLKKANKASAKSESKTEKKKKPGRPAGSKNKKATEKAVAKSDTPKRGRPKKVTSATTDTKEVKRKPGRPAKVKSATTEIKTETGKKRGRPAGSKNKQSASTVSTTTPKRKPGRPAKVKAATAEVSSTPAPKRGRPKKVESTAKKVTPATTRRRGRPAGSKNKVTAPTTTGKRGRTKDDLTLIEGIGPKMEEALRNGGIRTFNKMSTTTPEKLKSILVKANTRFGIAATDSWPTQAKLAARGAMEELKAYQDTLNRGR